MTTTTRGGAMSALALTTTPKLLERFGARYGVDPAKVLATLKATAFRQQNGEEISNEQMIALLIVADQYKLNPFTRELYAFPDRNRGIVPIVGLDGWARIINEHPGFDGMEFTESEESEQPQGAKVCPRWIECRIYRKDRAHPIAVKEYLDECYRPPFKSKKGDREYEVAGPWQSHTKRFLRHKAMIQCARIAFGFAGIYDEDEGHRIIEGEILREVEPEAEGRGARGVNGLKEKLKARKAKAAEPNAAAALDEAIDAQAVA